MTLTENQKKTLRTLVNFTCEDCKKHEMCRFNSLGYLISRDEITTVIAGELSDEGDYRNITLIPTGSIILIEKLVIAV